MTRLLTMVFLFAALACAKDDGSRAAAPSAQKDTPASDSEPAKEEGGATAAPVPSAPAVGQASDDSTYVVSVEAADGAAGQAGEFVVRIAPKKGWKLNLEFPTKVVLEPPAGVTVAKATLEKDDARSFVEKEGAVWTASYTAEEAGSKSFTADCRFAVCTDATCDPKRATVSFNVEVR